MRLLAFDLTPSLVNVGRSYVGAPSPMDGWYPWEIRDEPDGSAWKKEIRAMGSKTAQERMKDRALLQKVLENACKVSDRLQAALLQDPASTYTATRMNPWTNKPFEDSKSLITFSENEWRQSSKMETEVRISLELNTRHEAFLSGGHELESVIHLLHKLGDLVDPLKQESQPSKHPFVFLLLDILHGELLTRCKSLRQDLIHDETKQAEIHGRLQELRTSCLEQRLNCQTPPTTEKLMQDSCCRMIRRAYGGGGLDVPPAQTRINLLMIHDHLRDVSTPLLKAMLQRSGTALEVAVILIQKFTGGLRVQQCQAMMEGPLASKTWHLLQATKPSRRFKTLIRLMKEEGEGEEGPDGPVKEIGSA